MTSAIRSSHHRCSAVNMTPACSCWRSQPAYRSRTRSAYGTSSSSVPSVNRSNDTRSVSCALSLCFTRPTSTAS